MSCERFCIDNIFHSHRQGNPRDEHVPLTTVWWQCNPNSKAVADMQAAGSIQSFCAAERLDRHDMAPSAGWTTLVLEIFCLPVGDVILHLLQMHTPKMSYSDDWTPIWHFKATHSTSLPEFIHTISWMAEKPRNDYILIRHLWDTRASTQISAWGDEWNSHLLSSSSLIHCQYFNHSIMVLLCHPCLGNMSLRPEKMLPPVIKTNFRAQKKHFIFHWKSGWGGGGVVLSFYQYCSLKLY